MWQHKAPSRPTHDVSQEYNSGMCTVYSLEDVAPPGLRPRPQPTQLARLPYEERSLGVNRYFAARQNQIQIERVIRVPVSPARISSKDIVQTEDGETYAIEMIQNPTDTYPASLDLSLVAYKQEGWTDAEKDIVQTEDGETYAVEMIQKTVDTYPASLDLSLVAYKQEEWTDAE